MYTTRFSRCTFALLGCSLIFLLVACGATGVTPPTGSSSTSTVITGKTPLPTSTLTQAVTTAPVPPTQTSCPPQGSVRAAATAPLALGKDANIIYLVTEFSGSTPTSTLKRFDVTTGAKTEMLKMPGVTFAYPQVSADGQWILFVTRTGQHDELQMDRGCKRSIACRRKVCKRRSGPLTSNRY
jgi:hypothetical protein